jgi:dienelactone hydrolase
MKTLLTVSLTILCMAVPAFGAVQAVETTARDFVSLLDQKEFAKAVDLFDSNMKKAVSPAKLRAIWHGQLQAAGAFQSIHGTRLEVLGPYRAVLVTCQFENQRFDIKVVFDKVNNIAGMFFVPTQVARYQAPGYANRDTFVESDVLVGHGEWALPGTLTVPINKDPCPAVILVHGSGPQDRDETIGPNKPFRDLAWGLASRGIVVLRYEKRTRQYATKLAAGSDTFTVQEESIADASEAVSLLQKTNAVNSDRIYVLGHSLGGMLIPRIGNSRSDVAGLVIMAANTRPLEDLILEQTLFQASLKDELSPEDKRSIAEMRKQVAAVKNVSRNGASPPQLLGAPRSYWLDLKGYRPLEAAKAIQRPMLIMQGEKDCQVSSEKDFKEWRRALSNRRNVEFKLYPMLNHLFMGVDGKSTGGEYQQAGNIAAAVVSDIAAWIEKHED